MVKNENDFEARRNNKVRQNIGNAIAKHLGITVEGIDEIVGGDTCPDQIRGALYESFERGQIINKLRLKLSRSLLVIFMLEFYYLRNNK